MKIFDYADLGEKRSWDYSEKGRTPEDDGIMPILETEKEINMGDLFIINNFAYYVCCMSGVGMKMKYAYVEKLKEQDVFMSDAEPMKRDFTNSITCPYCGCEVESWEMSDSEEEYECQNCKSIFSYERNVTVEYCSSPVRKSEPIILN